MTVHLTLHHRYPRSIALLDGDDPTPLASIDCGNPRAEFPFADGSLTRIVAIDVLEHVVDEERWLGECARALASDGVLTLQVPNSGITSWLEALNIYRYAADIARRGSDPGETKPVGWHRHYGEADLQVMLRQTGFAVIRIRTHSLGLAELPHLVRLLAGDMIRNDPGTGETAKRARIPLDRLDSRIPAGPFSRRIVVTAKKL